MPETKKATASEPAAKKVAAPASKPKAYADRVGDYAADVAQFVADTREGLAELAEQYQDTVAESVPEPGQERLAAVFRNVHGTFADLGRALDAAEITAADLAAVRARLGS